MRYNEIATEAEDDDLFGASDRTHQNIRVANFRSTLPEFQQRMKALILQGERQVVRDIQAQLGYTVKFFKYAEEIADLASMMIEHEVVMAIPHLTQYIAQDPNRASSEDELYDYATELAEDIRHKSELWIYVQEVLEDMEDSGEADQEAEFECAMTISGEISSLLIHSAQEAFNNAPVSENFHDGKHPEDKGDSKRLGVPTHASISTLRKVAKQGGRKGQLAHWMANMKSGRAKKK